MDQTDAGAMHYAKHTITMNLGAEDAQGGIEAFLKKETPVCKDSKKSEPQNEGKTNRRMSNVECRMSKVGILSILLKNRLKRKRRMTEEKEDKTYDLEERLINICHQY